MEEKKGSGCLKAFLIVLSIVVILGIGLGYFIYHKGGEFLRVQGAKGIETVTEKILSDSSYSEQEKAEIREISNSFAEKLRTDQISLAQAASVAENLLLGPVMFYSVFSEIKRQHIEQSSPSPEEQFEIEKNISRIVEGLRRQLPTEDRTRIFESVENKRLIDHDSKETNEESAENPDAKPLTAEDRKALFAMFKEIADKNSIEDRIFPVNLIEEFRRAIEKGIAEPIDFEKRSQE